MIQKIISPLVLGLSFAGFSVSAFAAEGDAYTWPTYSSKLNYNFKDAGVTYSKPTKDVNASCANIAKNANGVS